MNDEVTKGSNGQNNNAVGQGGGICNIKVNTDNKEYKERHENITLKDTIEFWKEAFDLSINLKNEIEKDNRILKDENKTLKFQLQELHQANVNLHNESEKLKKDLDSSKKWNTFNSNTLSEKIDRIINLNEQLETKEIINQDLAKKYQILQEEIDAYDINTLELVEKHSKLEQDYNELQGKYNSLQEYAKNSSDNLFKVNLQHRVKPYLSEGVINVIVESNKEFN